MARRLKGLSPYEIMRQTEGAGDVGPGPVTRRGRVKREKRERRFTQDPVWWAEPLDALRDHWNTVREAVAAPLRIEVPRLILGAAGAALVLLVVLAFWIGHLTGGEAVGAPSAEADLPPAAPQALLALRDTAGPAAAVQTPTAPAPPDADAPASRLEREALARGGGAANQDLEEAPGGGDRTALPDADPRLEGLNYLALVTTTPEEARRIQAFFAEYGVATFITRPNNAGLVRLIDVSRGFTRDEYRSGAEADHRSHRLALGRAWKRFNRGIGDDLSSMAYSKYTGD